MSDNLRVLGIPGSLRLGSYNRGLLRAAVELAPAGVDIDVFDIAGIPLFNADVEAEGLPGAVRELKERLAAADALLIATPEYNYSIPGVLKNAIDWASRPAGSSPLRRKPVALMGASPGDFGTVRSQLALRQVFVFTESYVLPKPELRVSKAREHFDTDGNLVDDSVRAEIGQLLDALAAWVALVGRQP